MLENLKKEVFEANMSLYESGIVIYTWGNVSAISKDRNYMVIKPSGIPYPSLNEEDMVVVSLESGKVVEGKLKPSSDTPTHIELYKSFQEIGGICHAHPENTVAFSQAGKDITSLGTTHADYFYGNIPCTRVLSEEEVTENYEKNTGKVIVEEFYKRFIKYDEIPGVLVRNHGPFTWGYTPNEAVYHTIVMEKVASMNIKTLLLDKSSCMPKYILDKHYHRKHGEDAYYGQTQ